MAGRLVKDPAGTPVTLDPAGAVVRVLMDKAEETLRQSMFGSGTAQTRAVATSPYSTGTLQVLFTAADRQTFRGWMADLVAGTELDVYLDAAGSVIDRVVLAGERIEERYEYRGPVLWGLTLPVRRVIIP